MYLCDICGSCRKVAIYIFFFFFSSRRRHTRLQGDWSSDVCSSDLEEAVYERVVLLTVVSDSRPTVSDAECVTLTELGHGFDRLVARFGFTEPPSKIGRASCRERV